MMKILVVEDDRQLNHSVCAYLTQQGYDVTGCLDAQQAYDAMYGAMFDLIVSDVMMPGINGFEFAKTVREFNLLCKLLSLVWNNLFSNAIKFTDEGGRVSLSVKQDGNDALDSVCDTGCGFDAGIGAHIFEKFYQGDTSRATQGSGLGLALVRRVVDIHGGEIAVSSTPGRGSAFTVRIKTKEQ